jgi:heme/copper-type cytochrome/quinol oxidase subunit 3
MMSTIAAILTSGRLSNRMVFLIFCFSLCAFFKAFPSRFSFLRSSRSADDKGIRGVSILNETIVGVLSDTVCEYALSDGHHHHHHRRISAMIARRRTK